MWIEKRQEFFICLTIEFDLFCVNHRTYLGFYGHADDFIAFFCDFLRDFSLTNGFLSNGGVSSRYFSNFN